MKGLLKASVNIKIIHDIYLKLQYVPLLEKTIEEASVKQHADDEEKTGVESKIDTEESLKKELEEWNEVRPTSTYTRHILFRIAKFFMGMPRKKQIDAVQKLAKQFMKSMDMMLCLV